MLAFLISAHTDPQQLHRLIEALPDDSHFFIHIDKKADISLFTNEIEDPRVHFITHRVDVVWGSIVEVEYQMELIRAALSYGNHFDYLITLSGLDYPLWSKDRITQFFQQSNGREYLTGNDMSWQGKASKIYREYRILSHKTWRNGTILSKCRNAIRKVITFLGIRKPLVVNIEGKEYKLYKGAAWWAISSSTATTVLHEWDNNSALRHYFLTSFCPAETFIQTVVFNTPELSERCINVPGEYPGLPALTPLTYIYYHPGIKILTEEDYPVLIASDKMFARKLITGASDALVRKLRENS